MQKFLQVHTLTVYGANNLNRDDLNNPKSMIFGGKNRLRLSSQCIKRAYRMSDVMEHLMKGLRTKELFPSLGKELVAKGYKEEDVIEVLMPMRDVMVGTKSEGKAEAPGAEAAPAKAPKGKKAKATGLAVLASSTLYFFSDTEIALIKEVAEKSLQSGTIPGEDFAAKVEALPMSPDVALFGRMVASNKALSVEGALQVAHPFTVHEVHADDDYFTAVDDISTDTEGGAGHLGVNAFGAGVYYHYFNLDLDLLVKNLGGDVELAKATVEAFIEAAATVAPSAKQNSFAARSYASFLAVEVGNSQPVSYADAFIKPVTGDDHLEGSIEALTKTVDALEHAFPKQAKARYVVNRLTGQGSLTEAQNFVKTALQS